ncbi:hypothetical protein A2U01_0058992, partial [Trifolium medium]|nr:hypothetical protein [Trifolium medium]
GEYGSGNLADSKEGEQNVRKGSLEEAKKGGSFKQALLDGGGQLGIKSQLRVVDSGGVVEVGPV